MCIVHAPFTNLTPTHPLSSDHSDDQHDDDFDDHDDNDEPFRTHICQDTHCQVIILTIMMKILIILLIMMNDMCSLLLMKSYIKTYTVRWYE